MSRGGGGEGGGGGKIREQAKWWWRGVLHHCFNLELSNSLFMWSGVLSYLIHCRSLPSSSAV